MPQRTTHLFTGIVLLAASAAQAQSAFSIGPLAGLAVAGANPDASPDVTITYRTGFEAGIQSVVQVSHVAVQPSLRYAQKGFHYHYGQGLYDSDTDYRLNYLTLPLNVAIPLAPMAKGYRSLLAPTLECCSLSYHTCGGAAQRGLEH